MLIDWRNLKSDKSNIGRNVGKEKLYVTGVHC